MNKPHVHAEVIKAWADGAEIEVTADHGTWIPCKEPRWVKEYEYRVKPPCIEYRRFLWIASPWFPDMKRATVHVVTRQEQEREPRTKWTGFVRWIDNDYITEVL